MTTDPETVDRIKHLIAQELNEGRAGGPNALHLPTFEAALVEPRRVTVNFSGGITQKCWMVTRSNGAYRVIYLPTADYFSLCVESDFGPCDIGVHGPALACFASV